MPEHSDSLGAADRDWLSKLWSGRSAPPDRVLTASRRRLALLLVGDLLLVTAGLLARGPFGWFVAAFFGLAVIACAVQLVRPYQLFLSATGLEYRSPPRKPVHYEWSDCGEFRIWIVQRSRLIVFASTKTDHRALRSANRFLAGGDACLQSAYRGISAEQVVELLNSYRDRALGRSGASG